MFSFASKMLNSLIGEGEQPPRPQGPRPPVQGGPGIQPFSRPTRPQAPLYRGPGEEMGRPRLGVLGRNPSTQMKQPSPTRKEGGVEEPNLDLSHLSAEERAMIQNVMQKAKTLEDSPKVETVMSAASMYQQDAMMLGPGQAKGPQGMGPQGMGPQGMGPQGMGPQGMRPQGIGPQGIGPRPNIYSPYNSQQDNVLTQQQSNMQQHTNTQQHLGMHPHNKNQIHSSMQQHSNVLLKQVRPDVYNQGLGLDQYGRQDNYQENNHRQDGYHQQNGFQQQNEFQIEDYVQQKNEFRPDNFSNGYPPRPESTIDPNTQERPTNSYRQTQEQTRQEVQARQDQFKQGLTQDQYQVSRSEPFRQDVLQEEMGRHDLQTSQFRQDNSIQEQVRQEQLNRQQEAQDRSDQFRQDEFSKPLRQQDQCLSNPNKEFQLNRQDSYKQNNAYVNNTCWERSEKVQEEESMKEVVSAKKEPLVSTVKVEEPAAKDEGKPPSLADCFYEHSPGEVYTIPEEEDELASPTGGDGVTSLRKQRLAAADLELSDSLNEFNLNGHGVQFGRTSQRKHEGLQNDLTKRVTALGISDNFKHLSMKTDLEGPSAKSPLTTHKWETPEDFYGKPLEHEEEPSSPYKQFVQNGQQSSHPQQNQVQENHVTAGERHPDMQHANRPLASENVQGTFFPKPQSPVQRSPQSFLIRPKTQFSMKSNHIDTGIVSKEDTWKSSKIMQDEMRYQQMVHQEYPLDTIMYHNRGKPRPLHLQEDLQSDDMTKQMTQKQVNPTQQSNQAGKQSAGTISGMLADFSRALGLSSTTSPSRPSPSDDLSNEKHLPYHDLHSQDHNQPYQRSLTQQQIQAQIKANEQFIHGSQNHVQIPDKMDKTSMQAYQQNRYAYDNKGLTATDVKGNEHFGLQQKVFGVQQSRQNPQQIFNQQQNQLTSQSYPYNQQLQDQTNKLPLMSQGGMQQPLAYQQQVLQQQQLQQQQLQQQQLQQQQHLQHQQQLQQQQLQQQQQQQLHIQQSLQNPQRSTEYPQLACLGDSDQHQMYRQQQQLYQKLNEYQPMFAQNLTPQQQQMYQQHMQLQHHAQHLKKIRRSNIDPQRQGQFQKKENILNLIGQSTAVGSGVKLQLGSAHLVSQQPGDVQLLNSQHLSNYISADKLSALSRPTVVSSQTGVVTSTYGNHQVNSVTPLGTPQSTPVGTPRGPRDGGDSSDTMSETDSQKSLRTRRKLPSIPTDQEAVTLPSSKKRDRGKIKSPHDRFRQFGDGGYRIASNLLLQRPSASETNLRKVTHGLDPIPRPGSALGLLQGSSVVSSGLRSDYSKEAEIASCLPPDLRHLLSNYKSTDSPVYSTNKSLILQTYKDSLTNEMKLSAADRRALGRLSDWDSESLLDRSKDLHRSPKSRFDIQRKIAFSGIGRSRKLRSHRRQLSDPKLHLDVNPLKDTGESSFARGYLSIGPANLRPPYKSYEYESIDDGKSLDWDHSQPYLSSYAMAGGALRETAINSVLDGEHYSNDPSRYEIRRYSDSFEWRRQDVASLSKGRKPRSWQPSPFASDEEEDSLNREQKKAKIKAEIARRRQQIEENARLHEELLRLARLRESAELGSGAVSIQASLQEVLNKNGW